MYDMFIIFNNTGTWAIECYTCAGTGCGDPFDSTATGVLDTCPSTVLANTYCLVRQLPS